MAWLTWDNWSGECKNSSSILLCKIMFFLGFSRLWYFWKWCYFACYFEALLRLHGPNSINIWYNHATGACYCCIICLLLYFIVLTHLLMLILGSWIRTVVPHLMQHSHSPDSNSAQSISVSYIHNVTDLVNALPGNSSINTVQHATTEKAVFSVDLTDAPTDWLDSNHVICVYCRFMSVPRLYNESREL
jgi:hypothetical protein